MRYLLGSFLSFLAFIGQVYLGAWASTKPEVIWWGPVTHVLTIFGCMITFVIAFLFFVRWLDDL